MAKISRIKKRLVSDAIHENVDIIKGRLPRNLNPRLPFYRALARATPLAIGGGALLIGSLLFAKATREVPIAVPFPVSGSQALSAEVATLETLETLERFDAPGKIDPRVFPLGVRRVVLDPGHGGRHGGTVVGDLHESDITLDIAHRLRELLEADGLDVVMTRRHDTEVELADRVTFANQNRGDVFVSIHVNWLVTRAVRGVETYYLGPTDDPFLTELTSEENQGSGYSLTDFRRLLEGLFHDVRQNESRRFAQSVQSALYRSLLRVNPDAVDRGVKTAPFVVLIGTEMPAILAEVASLSNRDEAERLRKPMYRQYIAEALFSGIVDYTKSLAVAAPERLVAKGG